MRTGVIWALAAISLAACGGKKDSNQNGVSGGRIFGQAWTLHGAEARSFSAGKLTLHLFDAADHVPCQPYLSSATETGVDFEIPAQVGDYDVGSDQSRPLMFSQDSLGEAKGESTDSGKVHIASVSADAIGGSVVASDDDSAIDTAFTAKICP
jgi:hypothetical protein